MKTTTQGKKGTCETILVSHKLSQQSIDPHQDLLDTIMRLICTISSCASYIQHLYGLIVYALCRMIYDVFMMGEAVPCTANRSAKV